MMFIVIDDLLPEACAECGGSHDREFDCTDPDRSYRRVMEREVFEFDQGCWDFVIGLMNLFGVVPEPF